ncbi:MAG: hypothetical protein JNN17_06040 [Verrucomicrobiaceae bacterium]|nr:hypothetical protein [Verrucomicrobiaceae bacterium]
MTTEQRIEHRRAQLINEEASLEASLKEVRLKLSFLDEFAPKPVSIEITPDEFNLGKAAKTAAKEAGDFTKASLDAAIKAKFPAAEYTKKALEAHVLRMVNDKLATTISGGAGVVATYRWIG